MLRLAGATSVSLRLDRVARERRRGIEHVGRCSQITRCSASATNSPVWLGEHSVGLVDVNALPELAKLEVLLSVAEAAQAMSCRDTDSRLVPRLVFGRGLVVARSRRAVDESVDGIIVHELLLRAVRCAPGACAEVGVADRDCAVSALLMHSLADILALNIGRRPHTAQRQKDSDKSFNKGAQLGATNRVIVEDSEDYCQESSVRCDEETTSSGRLTGNGQRLTTHDEDDLHGAKLLETQRAARPDREPKLGAEDRTEHADTDDGHDVRSALRPVKVVGALWCRKDAFSQIGDVLTVADHQVETKADSEHCNDAAEAENAKAAHTRHGRSADDMDLRDQGQLDEDEDQGGHDAVGNGDPRMLAQARVAILLQREKDKVQKRTSHLGALNGTADDVADEGEYVEDPRQTAAFGCWSHKQQHKKQDRGGSKLGGEDDRGTHSGHPDVVDVASGGHLHLALGVHDLEGLVIDVEAGWGARRLAPISAVVGGYGFHGCQAVRCASRSSAVCSSACCQSKQWSDRLTKREENVRGECSNRFSSLSSCLDGCTELRLAQGLLMSPSEKTDSGEGNGSGRKLYTAALARGTMVWKRLCDAIVCTFTGASGADNAKA